MLASGRRAANSSVIATARSSKPRAVMNRSGAAVLPSQGITSGRNARTSSNPMWRTNAAFSLCIFINTEKIPGDTVIGLVDRIRPSHAFPKRFRGSQQRLEFVEATNVEVALAYERQTEGGVEDST